MPDEPFALAESGSHGLRITAVNAAAAREGLRPGLALADARARLPGLRSLPADPAADAVALGRLGLWAGRYGTALQAAAASVSALPAAVAREREGGGDHDLWIDITGVAHLFGGEASLLRDLVQRLNVLGITARPGLADSFGAAWAIARFSPSRRIAGRIAGPGFSLETIAPLPVEALRLEPKSALLLRRLGLKRIGQLEALPRPALKRRFPGREASEAVLDRLDQALGRKAEPGAPMPLPAAHAVRLAFADPLVSSEGIESAAGKLVRRLCRELAGTETGARRLRLVLCRSDGSAAEIRVGFSRPTREPDHILRLFGEKLAAVDAGFGIDLMGLAAPRVEPLAPRQTGMLTDSEDGLAPGQLIDRLVNRLGPGCVWQLASRASHIPEQAQALLPAALGALPGPGSGPAADACDPAAGKPPRPPFLLPDPEPIAVTAEVPEGPPRHFRWRRLSHQVRRAEGPERLSPAWWQRLDGAPDTATGPATATRDYYRIEDEAGRRFWVFRDGSYADPERPPRWYVHGLFA